MTKVELLESLIDEVEVMNSVEEIVFFLQEKAEDAIKEQEIRLMASSDALFNNDDLN